MKRIISHTNVLKSHWLEPFREIKIVCDLIEFIWCIELWIKQYEYQVFLAPIVIVSSEPHFPGVIPQIYFIYIQYTITLFAIYIGKVNKHCVEGNEANEKRKKTASALYEHNEIDLPQFHVDFNMDFCTRLLSNFKCISIKLQKYCCIGIAKENIHRTNTSTRKHEI